MSNNLKLRPMKKTFNLLNLALVFLITITVNAQNGVWKPFGGNGIGGLNVSLSTDSINNQLDIAIGTDTIYTFDGIKFGYLKYPTVYPKVAWGTYSQFVRTSGIDWFTDQNELFQGTGTYSSEFNPLLTGVNNIIKYANNLYAFGPTLDKLYPIIEYSGVDGSIKKQYYKNGLPTTGYGFFGFGIYKGVPYISVSKLPSYTYSTYKWNGSSWIFAFKSAARVLTEYNGNLYFQSSTDSVSGTNNVISAFDGTKIIKSWTFIGSGTPPQGTIISMTVFNGSLYVSGEFSSINGVPCNNFAIYTETPSTTGIESTKYNTNWFNVYPNPFSDQLNINSDHRTKITISDATGREIVSKVIESGIQNIDLSSLKSGMYILRTSDGLTKKITKP